MKKLRVKILVAYHKKAFTVKNEVFEPIHVGKVDSDLDLGMISDCEGVNISKKNRNYSELTALYWGWKNLRHEDYIGLCHYRRFFSFRQSIVNFFRERISFVCSFVNYKNFDGAIRNNRFINDSEELTVEINKFTELLIEDIERSGTELYALKKAIFAKKSIKLIFCRPGGEYVLDLLMKIVDEKYPDYAIFLKSTLLGNKIHYANMTIMKKEIFDEYCNFLFDVLETHENQVLKYGWCLNIENEGCYYRLSGYLGEILTSAFISRFEANNIKVKYLNAITYIE